MSDETPPPSIVISRPGPARVPRAPLPIEDTQTHFIRTALSTNYGSHDGNHITVVGHLAGVDPEDAEEHDATELRNIKDQDAEFLASEEHTIRVCQLSF